MPQPCVKGRCILPQDLFERFGSFRPRSTGFPHCSNQELGGGYQPSGAAITYPRFAGLLAQPFSEHGAAFRSAGNAVALAATPEDPRARTGAPAWAEAGVAAATVANAARAMSVMRIMASFP